MRIEASPRNAVVRQRTADEVVYHETMAAPTGPLPTAVQRFLADLIRTEGPEQLVQLLLENPRWLDKDWLRHAEEYVRNRQHIGTIFTSRPPAKLWRQVVRGALRASSIATFDQLAEAASEERVLLWSGFKRTLQAIDAKSETKRFGTYFQAQDEWDERLRQINEIETLNYSLDQESNSVKGLTGISGVRLLDLALYAKAKAPLAVAESTLLYLAAYTQFCIDSHRVDKASALVPVLERLEGVGFNVRQLRKTRTGQKTAFRRTNSGGASLGFLQNGVPLSQYIQLSSAVASGKRTFDSVMDEAQAIALRIFDRHIQEDRQNGSDSHINIAPATREFFLVTCTAAFTVITASAINNTQQSNASIQKLKRISQGAWWGKLKPGEKASVVYNICSFIMEQVENLPDPRHELLWARESISNTISGTALDGHPGLERDLRLAHARIISELSKWDPRLGADAIAEFERGLQVDWGRFDCEARGMGLCDLAGAMWRYMKSSTACGIEEDAIESLYKTALVHLTRERSTFGRITVLANYAIFLNERHQDNDGHNQELALRLVDEALEIERDWRELQERELQGLEESGYLGTPHRATIQASIWLTRGNIIRARTFGQMPAGSSILIQIGALPKGLDDVTASAIASYQEGLRALGETGHDARRGLLYLNIGYAYLENRTAEPQHTQALIAFRQSMQFLEDLPHNYTMARVAEIETLFSSSRDSPNSELLTWQSELGLCASEFETYGDLPRACRALILRSRVLGRVGRPAHLARAYEAASRAASLAAQLGGGELLVYTLQAQARRSIAWMHRTDGAHRIGLTKKADEALTEALKTIDDLLGQNVPLSMSIFLHEQRSAVAANIIWLRSQSSPALPDTQQFLLRLASTADVLANKISAPSTESVTTRNKMLQIEDLLWASGRAANVEQHVGNEVEQLIAALDDLQRSLEVEAIMDSSLTTQRTEAHAEDDEGAAHSAVTIQFIISEWGGVAVIRDAGTNLRTIPLPVNRATIYQWLHGLDGTPGWIDSYNTLRAHGRNSKEWRVQCEVLQAQISESLWGPLLRAKVPLEGRLVYVVPGQLAGLPLHTAFLGDRLLIEVAAGFGYLPTLDATRIHPPASFQRGLLVLSDPVQACQSELPAAVGEIASVARVFQAHGIDTRVLAHSWGRTGREAFPPPHLLPDKIRAGDPPTPENTLEAISSMDLFVYAGHGHGVGSYGGALALTDESGRRIDLSLMKALASSPLTRGTGVILSACETAWAMSALSNGRTSIASTFLRLGASFVLGSLWSISDSRASTMSNAFLRALLAEESPEQAFAKGVHEMIQDGSHVSRWGAYCIWFGQTARCGAEPND